MSFAFTAPISVTRGTAFTGERVATNPTTTNPAVVRASLYDVIAKRARMDTERLSALFSKSAVSGAAVGALAAAALVFPGAADALTRSDIDQLSYLQVKGTGLANRCPEVQTTDSGKVIKLDPGKSYKFVDLCLEPKSFQVEEEVQTKRKGETKKTFVDTKLMTRATYTLTGIEGSLKVTNDGLLFEEKEGLDYAATTVQLPGGERVPFLFTIKNLVAKASGKDITTATEFGGEFQVPSYRSGLFLDPKGRGGTVGYDMAVALPALEADGAEGQSDLFKESNKVFLVTDGAIEMAVQKVDAGSGEIGGVFVSEQLSDTDMGAKAPKKVLLKGIFFGRVDEA